MYSLTYRRAQSLTTQDAERHLAQPRRDAAADLTHPVAWAGFTLSGDPGRFWF